MVKFKRLSTGFSPALQSKSMRFVDTLPMVSTKECRGTQPATASGRFKALSWLFKKKKKIIKGKIIYCGLPSAKYWKSKL